MKPLVTGYREVLIVMCLGYVTELAAWGTAKAGHGILLMGVQSPDLVWRSLIPIIMAGVNGIYGLIISVVISSQISEPQGGKFILTVGNVLINLSF